MPGRPASPRPARPARAGIRDCRQRGRSRAQRVLEVGVLRGQHLLPGLGRLGARCRGACQQQPCCRGAAHLVTLLVEMLVDGGTNHRIHGSARAFGFCHEPIVTVLVEKQVEPSFESAHVYAH
ncbi:hypothetical protein BN11_440006 [Nostocoides australiense Ben110]|uniref:Uncharacterized protein n=1 Tax=Nostocoides australiense Ben110 TaxID=1193182 RepID=W6JZ48_9MICO|nr:hypothetical protein BN11_440006 [Tetrasphaera australiensis Ben110]